MRNSIAVDHEFNIFNDKQYGRFMSYLVNVENNKATFTKDNDEIRVVSNHKI
jgi:hypothetical protein